jgi:T-box
MDIVPYDSRRYRYAYHRSSWLVAGKADPAPTPRLYAHPDTPLGADVLRRQVISFEKVKLTNDAKDGKKELVSHAHHYKNTKFSNYMITDCVELHASIYASYPFSEIITSSKYSNHTI